MYVIFRPNIVKWIIYKKNNYLLLPEEVPIVAEAFPETDKAAVGHASLAGHQVATFQAKVCIPEDDIFKNKFDRFLYIQLIKYLV